MASPVDVVTVSSHCTAYIQPPGGWFVNNAGWVTGQHRSLLVDTCATEDRTRALLAAVEASGAPQPLDVVLTHAHGDHAHGAGLVADRGGHVIATASAADEIAAGPHTYPGVFQCDHWGAIDPPAETTPITETTTLDLGGIIVELIPVGGTAHTSGDLLVWVPDEHVLFTGDLVFAGGVTPLTVSGSVVGWLGALEYLQSLPIAHLVPGHGPVPDHPAEAIATVRDYLTWLRAVTAGIEHPDFLALESQAHTRFPGWIDAERHAANLRMAHAELAGHPPPFAEALAAMQRTAGGTIPLDLSL